MSKVRMKVTQLTIVAICASMYISCRYLPVNAEPVQSPIGEENVLFLPSHFIENFFNADDVLAISVTDFINAIQKNLPAGISLDNAATAETIVHTLWEIMPVLSNDAQQFLQEVGTEKAVRLIKEKQATELFVHAFCSNKVTIKWEAFVDKLAHFLGNYKEYKSFIADLKKTRNCWRIKIVTTLNSIGAKHEAAFSKFFNAFQKRYQITNAALGKRVMSM